MFCPKCGCHAGPDGSRFCRNCGFRLDGVAQLMSRNGAPESYTPPLVTVPLPSPSPRKKGVRKGGKIMFGALASLPIFIGICAAVNSGDPLVVPVFVFFAGLVRMLYARLFEDASPVPPSMVQPVIPHPVAQPASLPPGNYQPLAAPHVNVPTTGNLVAPPSVVEPTTSLLKRQ